MKLSHATIISGEETLLVNDAVTEIETTAKALGYTEKKIFDQDNNETWERFIHDMHAQSLFADKSILLCRFSNQKISPMAQKALQEFAEKCPSDKILIVIMGKLTPPQQQSIWFQALKKRGQLIQLWPVPIKQFPTWVKQRLHKAGFHLDQAALQLLCDHSEGNLLAAQQCIEKCKLLYQSGDINETQLLACLAPSARYTVFDLVNAVWLKQFAKINAILDTLRTEEIEPAIVLWAIARECRKHHLAKIIPLLYETDQTIKGLATGSAWSLLQRLCFAIAGKHLLNVDNRVRVVQ
jgi:DNA polymerase III subunit delta